MSGTYANSEMSALSQVIDDESMLKITANFKRLGERSYLENAGATLYPHSLLLNVNEDLMNNVYMNPHSDKYTKDCIEQIRYMILKHFNTDSTNYTVIFTSGTTQSLKLILESFQFASEENSDKNNGSFIYLRDNHTSVLGLREIAADRNADIVHLSHDDFLAAVNTFQKKTPSWTDKFKSKTEANTLFVYPAQSNFNGFKYPIDCIDSIKNGCLKNYLKKNLCKINKNWYVLLDAASYVSTSKLDLSKVQPDFMCFSFYKIFGYPTGLGALLVKNSSQEVLNQKRYFGGGTVDIVLSSENFHVKRKNLSERFEDGTVPFLSIISLKQCFDTLQRLIPRTIYDNTMDTISHHTFDLAKDLYYQLQDLHHSNGNKAAVLYMDSDFTDIKKQGAIVTFNLLREDGSYVGYAEFQHMADLFNISVRTGCFCNSGSCQRHLLSTNKEIKEIYKAGHVCGDELDIVGGKPTGAVRVSFAYFNTFKDIDKLIAMICQCFVKTKIGRPKRIIHKHITLESPKPRIFWQGLSNLHKILSNAVYLKEEPEYAPFDSKIILKEAAIFPIKSCGAFKIHSSWKIGLKGFEYDREWMIIKDNGVCLTQKQMPRMCMIRPKIDLEQRIMTLYFKGKSSITVSLNFVPQSKYKESSFCHTKVCTDTIQGYDCGDEVADWISEALEISYLRLIRQSSTDQRIQKKKRDGEQKQLSLSNQAQFLLVNKATVRWLRDQIRDPLFTDDIDQITDRFRGNIIIDMDTELVEREWQKIIIGNQEFRVEGPCNRCQMVCINQQNGDKTPEPLRTISEQFGGKLRFGIYLSYLGPVNGAKDNILRILAPVRPIINDDDISR